MTSSFSSYAQMSEEAEKYIRELETWMEDHGAEANKPWPAHIIASKAKRLSWAEKCREIFSRGARRDDAA